MIYPQQRVACPPPSHTFAHLFNPCAPHRNPTVGVAISHVSRPPPPSSFRIMTQLRYNEDLMYKFFAASASAQATMCPGEPENPNCAVRKGEGGTGGAAGGGALGRGGGMTGDECWEGRRAELETCSLAKLLDVCVCVGGGMSVGRKGGW